MLRKKRLVSAIMVMMLVFLVFPSVAMADMGPKPSITIDFEGLEGVEYHVTLLSGQKESGPWQAVTEEEIRSHSDDAVFQKFAAFSDPDGYFFMGWGENYLSLDENMQYRWTYYPPYSFKILMYFPETDQYAVSDIYERYAFDAYYRVDLSDLVLTEGGSQLLVSADRSYDYTGEILSFLVRFLLTFVIELGIAWLFGYRKGQQWRIILVTNLITQVFLNLVLGVAGYKGGLFMMYFVYILAEIAVVILESVIYSMTFRRLEQENGQSRRHPVLYAMTANAASFVIGIWLSGRLAHFF